MRDTSSRSSTNPHHLVELPLHHVARVAREVGALVGELEQREAVAQRRERVAQLVRERGEELVLAPVGGTQRLLGAAPLDHLALQRPVRRLDLVGAATHLGEHRVERVDQRADLVVARPAHAQREVALLDDALGDVGDLEDRRRHRSPA
jgi:hypothetical protein